MQVLIHSRISCRLLVEVSAPTVTILSEESAWKNICTRCNREAGRKNNLSIQMTPKQRRKANALIRKSCCNYDGGNCIALDDGEPCVCVQSISYSLCCT